MNAVKSGPSYPRLPYNFSEGRNTSRDKVDRINRSERDQKPRELFKPGMEIRSGHEQHPPTHSRDTQCNLDAETQIFDFGDVHVSLCVGCLDGGAFGCAVVHADSSVFAESTGSEHGGENF